MRHALLIHTTDLELYLILRYILEQDGHNVDLAPNLDGLLRTAPLADTARHTIIVCLSVDALLRASTLIRKDRPEFSIVGFPLDNTPIEEADLYFDHLVTRPFDPSQLLNFLKFGAPLNPKRQNNKTVTFADVEIDLAAIRVRRGNADVKLSPLHFRLLVHLAQHADRVVSRDELIEYCWPAAAIVEPRTVDIHVGRIRQALNQYGDNVIRTVRSIGYAAAKVP